MEKTEETNDAAVIDPTPDPENNSESECIADGPSNDYINKLTLEMFMNRKNYGKYLEKSDPDGHAKQREYKQKLRKYMVDIVNITSQMIEDPDDSPNQEIKNAFSDFSKSIIKYYEMRELEQTNPSRFNNETYNDSNDDTMFDPNNMEESNSPFFNQPNQPKWSGFHVNKKRTKPFNGHFV